MASEPPPPPPSSSIPPNLNHLVPPVVTQDPFPPPAAAAAAAPCGGGRILFPFPKRPSLRVTSEFDSETSAFFHKVSCKLLDNLAKLKLSFQNTPKGEIAQPQLAFISKHLSIHYDVEEQNTLLTSSFDVGPRLHFKAAHDVKAQQGEVSMVADLADPGYGFELTSPVPAVGMPRATLKFPLGEVSLLESQKEVESEEEVEPKRALSVNAIVKQKILSGVCSAQYNDDELKLRYCYKDDELSFIPCISLPSNALSFAFKRRFTPSSKLSYWYNFDSNYWSTVYKHTYGKEFKVKAGYDSEVRLAWASLWVGDENGKAKAAPLKMKVQFMLQVPQDDINQSVLMFRVKKRWDI